MIVRVAAGIVAFALFASPLHAQTPGGPAEVATQDATVAPPATRDTPPSFGSLFLGLARDFRQLPSRETALILGAAGGITLAARRYDVGLTRLVSTAPSLDRAFEPGDQMGGGVAQVGGAFATFAIGRMVHSPRLTIVGADLVRAQIVNTVLTHGIKLAVGRTRPDGGAFSFPSGHTSSSFATAAVLQRHFGWKAGVAAFGLAGYIAGSRLQENKHYLSDGIIGAAVGIVAARTVTIGRGPAKFAVSPLAVPRGGGIGFTWVGAH